MSRERGRSDPGECSVIRQSLRRRGPWTPVWWDVPRQEGEGSRAEGHLGRVCKQSTRTSRNQEGPGEPAGTTGTKDLRPHCLQPELSSAPEVMAVMM